MDLHPRWRRRHQYQLTVSIMLADGVMFLNGIGVEAPMMFQYMDSFRCFDIFYALILPYICCHSE